jgi:hypothetical protein
MFRVLDSRERDRYRLRKFTYRRFLHRLAQEQNQYQLIILLSLRTIYEKSYKRIILLKSQKLKKSGVSGSNEIGVNSGFDNLFHSFSGEFATEIANAIENISSNIFVDAAILAVISVYTCRNIKTWAVCNSDRGWNSWRLFRM